MIHCLIYWMIHWMIHWLIFWFIELLIYWFIHSFILWMIHWLIHLLIDCPGWPKRYRIRRTTDIVKALSWLSHSSAACLAGKERTILTHVKLEILMYTVQGYPYSQRIRLQRRLYEITLSVSVYFRFPSTVTLFLCLSIK